MIAPVLKTGVRETVPGVRIPPPPRKVLVILSGLFLSHFDFHPVIHFVYILYSEKLNAFYKGQTNDLNDRVCRHNEGLEKFTCNGVPWLLVWSTPKNSRQEAIALESKLKNLTRKRLLIFINKYTSGIHITSKDWERLRGS